MKYIMLFFFFTIFFVQASSITVAVAANLTYSIKPLIKVFHEIYPQIDVQFIVGSSGKLTAQIMHGAPYDILMSANMQYPNNLYAHGLTFNKPVVYAKGTLALLLRDSEITNQTVKQLLCSDKVSKIAIANPKTAPYGIATIEALHKLDIYDTIKNKLVYGESISQTVLYTTEIAEIGIIAMSALYAPHLNKYHEHKHWIALDTSLYKPIEQGIVVLKNSKNIRDSNAFYNFIQSPSAQKVLHAYGYTL